jgi:hypothetical protein
MADVIVRATAARWASDDFPGWIEFQVVDAEGRSHRVVEKVPVLTTNPITAASDFPFELWLRATCDYVERESAVIRFTDGVTTTEGLDQLRMDLNAIRWL